MWSLLYDDLRERAMHYSGIAGFAVRDLTDGTGIEFRGNEEFPSASTIKIHILTAMLWAAERGELSLSERLPVTRDILVPGSGVLTYLEHAVELSLFDIAVLMILVSDNTATNICIERVGMERVNALAAELGLRRTALRRVMQDRSAIAEGRENVSTPLDLVATLASLYEGRPTASSARQALDVLSKSKPSPFRLAIPAEVRLAHKTGRMSRVRAEAGIVYLSDRPYALAVMTRFGMCDEAEQDALLSAIARRTHAVMNTLAQSNRYGQGLSKP